MNECSPNPCKNNGLCVDGDSTFTCSCAVGWSGATCEEPSYCETAMNPCQNGATCVSTGSSPFYSCSCAPGFTGDTCLLSECGAARRGAGVVAVRCAWRGCVACGAVWAGGGTFVWWWSC